MIKDSKKHLKDAGENYLQHMWAALKISFQLFITSLQALFHSIIPSLFTKSASTKIKELYFSIEERKKNNH
jgi:hypothetical protein